MDSTATEQDADDVLAQLHAGIEAAEALVRLVDSGSAEPIEEAALAANAQLSDALRNADAYYAANKGGDERG